MNCVALIPARKGSKSIIDKNIAPFMGKPLLIHSIIHGLETPTIDRVIVSTDDKQYAEIAKNAGAYVPFFRPNEFANDASTDLEVFRHCLEWLKQNAEKLPDIIVQLRPTYPIRSPEDIDKAIKLLVDNPEADSVRSVSRAIHPPFKTWLIDGKFIKPAVTLDDHPDAHSLPRQLLPEAYVQNACVDVIRTSTILEKNSMAGEKVLPFLMENNFDIDDIHQFLFNEKQALFEILKKNDLSGHSFCFDIDGVIAELVPTLDYEKAKPREKVILYINKLHNNGAEIHLYTARGSKTGKDWKKVTTEQMEKWGVKHHSLTLGKPAADIYVDDRALNISDLASLINID